MARSRTAPPPRNTDPLVDRLIEPVPVGPSHWVLALVWVAAQVLALVIGVGAVALLFGVVAGVAGLQASRAWRAAGLHANRVVAGFAPLILTLAAAAGLVWAGLGLIALAVVAVVLAVGERGPGGPVVTAAATVRSALGPAVVGVSVVQLFDVGLPAAAMLLALAAGYDVACNVWSSDGAGPLVGRLVGVLTVVVLTFGFAALHTVFELEPFGPISSVWVFGGLAAVLCPLGPMAASGLLPAADADTPAYRRLDSLIVAAPVWMLAMWGYLA